MYTKHIDDRKTKEDVEAFKSFFPDVFVEVERSCLKCGKKFVASSKVNRICNHCKTGKSWGEENGDYKIITSR